ncbi:MAG TPA: protein kinase [Gemmatimonadales bacterium]|nr:protein kinase [Gemmatimonadales bacterium]
MSLSPGARIAQYEVVAPLGAGGMGEVYRAHDSRLGRDVALKVLPERFAGDPDMRARFEHEARAVAAISHPNIMAIHELAFLDGLPVAVIELIEGESLRDRILRGPMPWRETVQMAARIADGLGAAHAKGIVHRDLKPENVFVTPEGRPKILDFGLARTEPAMAMVASATTFAATEPGRVLGTVGYMAPEQVRGEAATPATDVFALGCTMAEMLTGTRPFARATPAESVAAVLTEPAPDLLATGLDLPPRLAEIVAHCLEKDVAHRFSSARDVATALRALLTESSSNHAATPRRRSRTRSLAVLPFVTPEGDDDADYLADGITESIINSLSQLPKLRVVPRSTVFAYKGRVVSARSVGLALNVDVLVTGRVVQQGGTLNIQAELVDVVRETQVWGDQYRYPISDLLAMQEQIAWQISEALRIRLTGQEKKRLRSRPTGDSEAYQEYLRGRHEWNKWRPDAFQKAIEHFERAIERDPKYARAYAGLGDTYGAMGYYGFMPTELAMTRSSAAAYKALDLDPKLAEAHATLGMARTFYLWDWIGAEHAFKKAIELDARYPIAHMMYGLLLSCLGRHDEAMAESRRGRDLDPLSLLMQIGVAWASYFARRYSDALDALRDVLVVQPGNQEALTILATIYERMGLLDRAADTFASVQQFFGVGLPAELTASLKGRLQAEGPRGYWVARQELLCASEGSVLCNDYAVAGTLGQLGDIDSGLAALERMVGTRSGHAVFLGVDPALDPLRENPRFEALLRRIGLPAVLATR